MKWTLGKCVPALVSALVFVAVATQARAEFPERPITLIVGFPAGSANDVFARILAPDIAKRLGQPVVVENKPGANGTVAAKFLAKSPPDGYTISLSGLSNIINSILKPDTGVELADLTWVALIGRKSNVMLVSNQSGLKTVDEVVAFAKANPGKLSCGSGGIGASPHYSCELFKAKTGVDIRHVPYATTQAITDVIGGRLELLFDSAPHAKPFIEEGKVRALAVLGAVRSGALPDIPTLRELNYDIAITTWTGIVTAPKTPLTIVEKLNQAFRDTLSSPKIAEQMTGLGFELDQPTAKEFQEFAASEQVFWAALFKQAGIVGN